MPESPVPPSLAAFLPSDLPSPLKAIAGIAVTMLHDVKHLPERAIQLPTSVLTRLASTSLKVQQQYAEWVTRGEEFLGSLQEPTEEIPAWATFDEDLPDPEPARQTAAPRTTGLGPGSAFDLQDDSDVDDADDADEANNAEDAAPAAGQPDLQAHIEQAAPAKKPAPSSKEPAKKTGATKKSAPVKKAAPAKKSTAAKKPTVAAAPVEDAAAVQPSAGSTTPTSLPDFDTLTIPQLRTRLRTLRSDEIKELIAHEAAGHNRAPVIGMLRARLDTLQQ